VRARGSVSRGDPCSPKPEGWDSFLASKQLCASVMKGSFPGGADKNALCWHVKTRRPRTGVSGAVTLMRVGASKGGVFRRNPDCIERRKT